MAKGPTRRAHRIVNRSYQLRVVRRSILLIFAIATASCGLAVAILSRYFFNQDIQGRYFVMAGLIGAAITLFVEMILMIPILYYASLRQSHAVVGPIDRMIRALQRIGQGDFSPRLHLRPGDALHDVAKAINELATNLEKRSGG